MKSRYSLNHLITHNRDTSIFSTIKNICSKIIHAYKPDILFITLYAILLLPKVSMANTLTISNKYNFLSIENQSIKSIIGDVSTFDIQRLNKKILFIPKFKKEANVSIISSSGEMQKLHLNVLPISPQDIILPAQAKPTKQLKKLEEKSTKFFNKIMKNIVQFEPVASKAYRVLGLKVKYEGYFTHKDLIADVYTLYSKNTIKLEKIANQIVLNILINPNTFYLTKQNYPSAYLKHKQTPKILFSMDEYLSKNKPFKIIVIQPRQWT